MNNDINSDFYCINKLSEIIKYSKLSHKLKNKQIFELLLCHKYSINSLDKLPLDVLKIIIDNLDRNNWEDTKKILQKKN